MSDFSMRPTEDLIRIAAVGGGFRLDAGSRPTEDLIRIAGVANKKGARLIFAGLNMRPTEDLIRIAKVGGGAVVFEG